MQQLSTAEEKTLRALLGHMIPASVEYGVPAADDPEIFADIVASTGRDGAVISALLHDLDAPSSGPFTDLDLIAQQDVAAKFLTSGDPRLSALNRVVLQCYYRDARVMKSLGMEARPPFPQGFVVEQGDWTLLEPVQRRPKVYRDVPC
jgi:hypothetical protein